MNWTKRARTGMALLTIGLLAGCTNESDGEPVVMSIDEQIEWVEEFDLESTYGQAMFDDVMETFSEGYELLDDEQKESATGTLFHAIQGQSHRLNSIASGFTREIHELMDEYPDVDFETGENYDSLPEGVVRGLLAELDSSYSRLIQQASGQLVVGIDQERLMTDFESSMTPETINRITLASFEQAHSMVDYERGHLAFDTIWDGLDMIESLNSDTDDLYMQNELPRLFYYRALLGYEEISMENEDGSLNEEAIEAMEDMIEKHPNHRRSEHLLRIVESAREEGIYGEQTHLVADAILEEEFEALYAEMSEELGLGDSDKTDTANESNEADIDSDDD